MCGEVTAVSRAYRVTQCMKKAQIMAIKLMAWSIMQVNNDTDENKIFKGANLSDNHVILCTRLGGKTAQPLCAKYYCLLLILHL